MWTTDANGLRWSKQSGPGPVYRSETGEVDADTRRYPTRIFARVLKPKDLWENAVQGRYRRRS